MFWVVADERISHILFFGIGWIYEGGNDNQQSQLGRLKKIILTVQTDTKGTITVTASSIYQNLNQTMEKVVTFAQLQSV
jgi:hypothetical protein